MELSFVQEGKRELLIIDDARIVHRNFSGVGSMYNREGDRNFSLIIPTEELKEQLVERGWNVKIKPPREEGDVPFMFLPVKVAINDRGPDVYLVSGAAKRKLGEESISCLDNIDILTINMDIRAYDWNLPDGRSGRTAYLQGMEVIQKVNRFAPEYTE
jgi:hypothetical protein